MKKSYPRYNPVDWVTIIEKYAHKAGKYKLLELDGIWITTNELKTITDLNNKVLERLAFTLLCLAKFKNKRNENNNSWVNNEDSEIFKLARITTSAFDKDIRFNQLRKLGLLEYARKISNLNIQVLYVDDKSKNELFISDFRELGYEYLLYKGGSFIRCADCGILTRRTNNRIKYCKCCSNENKLKLDRDRMGVIRKSRI